MFSDREGCRFLCLIGESVLAVRQNWKDSDKCLESVGALPFTKEITAQGGTLYS